VQTARQTSSCQTVARANRRVACFLLTHNAIAASLQRDVVHERKVESQALAGRTVHLEKSKFLRTPSGTIAGTGRDLFIR
jgi:hypothetical protein